MRFTKMHGLGNDYLFVYGEVPPDVGELTRRLSDRHFGAGSDGMIFIGPSRVADFSMRIFNADGSEAMMCGNGIRCVGKYVFDKHLTDKTELEIETKSGIRTLSLATEGGVVVAATVDMGKAEVGDELTVASGDTTVTCTPVCVGNPHAVIFCEDAEASPVEEVGCALEHHEAFPGGVNVEFVSVLSPSRLRMRVWERGSGITWACGTGSCASVAAAIERGVVEGGRPVTVVLDGGELEVEVDADMRVEMRGEAVTVYEGEVEL